MDVTVISNGGPVVKVWIYLSWPVALQLKHIHGVVDPPTVVVKLDVPGQPLNVHLH